MADGVFDADGAARKLAEALRSLGTPERAAQEKRYLKSELEFFGVTVPELRRAVKSAYRGYPGLNGDAALAWAVALWREPVHERRMAAVEVLALAVPRLAAADLHVVASLVRGARTWALVDGLACTVAGGIALRDPSAWPLIDPWAADPDFWVRRSALLALLPGIRAGTASHLGEMSGVTFREAVRRLPAAEAERLRDLRAVSAPGAGRHGATS